MQALGLMKQVSYTKTQPDLHLSKKVETGLAQKTHKENKTSSSLYQKKKNSFVNGLTAYFATIIPVNIIKNIYGMNCIKKMNKKGLLNEQEAKLVNEGLDRAYNILNLKSKGVNIYRVTSENVSELVNIIKKDLQKTYLKFYPDYMKTITASNLVNIVKNGQNEFWFKHSKSILLPQKGMELTAFHELGHAIDYVFSKTGRVIQNTRSLLYLPLLIMMFGCFTQKESETKDKKLTKFDKIKNFIRDNAGKLSAVATVPVLYSEGMATLKGYKIAKKVLSPENSKKMLKTSLIGFSSYVVYAALLVGASIAAVKIKDELDKY